MQLITRLLAILVVVPATYFFIYWVPFSLLSEVLGEQRWVLAKVVSLICAVVAGWFVWSKLGSAHQGLISSILIGAISLGGVGFSAGFFGPLIFTPQANQGPLLGIFITGPLGFVLGGVAGFLYWSIRCRKTQT